jgi:hypothetical protein
MSDREPKLRHEFVGMIFAVALGEVGLQTAVLVRAGNVEHFLPAYFHLGLATVVIATSWVGWALSQSPGARMDVHSVFELEFLVLLLDVLLVIAYFILVKSVDITGEGENLHFNPSAAPESLWVFVIFCGYVAWDILCKIFLYRKHNKPEPWLHNYGVRIVPTVVCTVIAYFIWQWVRKADPPHILTADLSLVALVLFFRALKELASSFFPKPNAEVVRSRKYWAIGWSVTLGLAICASILWTLF